MDELRFDGRVAVVTGSGGGVGRQHALLLAARGASVVVNDIGGFDGVADRPRGEADAVVDEIRSRGGQAVACSSSITDPEGAAEIVACALDTYGRLDVLVNNAGILRSCDFADMTIELWDEVIDVNLRGAFLVTRAVWPTMIAQGYGRVVSTTSNSGLLGVPGSSAYATSKAALWGLTRVLALEGAEYGVHANAVAPIAFTEMSRQSRAVPASWRDGDGDEWAQRLDPAQISPVVAWLTHEDCTLNGEVLSAAGGRAARFFMGLTHGHAEDTLTIEAVRDHEADIVNVEDFDVLPRAFEEGRRLRRRLLR